MATSPGDDGRLARGAATRSLLLTAGAELLVEQASAGSEKWRQMLSVRELSERTGRSSGAFYKQFGGMDEYWDHLLRWILDPAWFGVQLDADGNLLEGAWEQALREAAGPAEGLGKLGAAAAEDVRQLCDGASRHGVVAWLAAQPEAGVDGTPLNAALAHHYDVFDTATRAVYGQLMREIGHPLEAPQLQQLALVVTANVEGAWQRWRSSSSAQPVLAELCGRSVTAFARELVGG